MNDRWKPSVTVAAVIHRAEDDCYLLVEEHTREGVRLNNPAGHLEPGETPLQGVMREVLEETRHPFAAEALLGVYLARFQRRPDDDVTYLRMTFCGTVGAEDPTRELDEPIIRTHWMSYDAIVASQARHRSPMVLRGINDHRRGLRYPLAVLVADPSLTRRD